MQLPVCRAAPSIGMGAKASQTASMASVVVAGSKEPAHRGHRGSQADATPAGCPRVVALQNTPSPQSLVPRTQSAHAQNPPTLICGRPSCGASGSSSFGAAMSGSSTCSKHAAAHGSCGASRSWAGACLPSRRAKMAGSDPVLVPQTFPTSCTTHLGQPEGRHAEGRRGRLGGRLLRLRS